MRSNNLLDKITWDFIHLKEAREPNISHYINEIKRDLRSISRTPTNSIKVDNIVNHLREITRHVTKMQERVHTLEEQVKVLEELKNKDNDLVKEEENV